jgi:hypothetical protein
MSIEPEHYARCLAFTLKRTTGRRCIPDGRCGPWRQRRMRSMLAWAACITMLATGNSSCIIGCGIGRVRHGITDSHHQRLCQSNASTCAKEEARVAKLCKIAGRVLYSPRATKEPSGKRMEEKNWVYDRADTSGYGIRCAKLSRTRNLLGTDSPISKSMETSVGNFCSRLHVWAAKLPVTGFVGKNYLVPGTF